MKKTDTLLFATGNANKLQEIREILFNTDFDVKGLIDLGFNDEIPETGNTLEENALIKAVFLYEKTGLSVLAEDTGLEVSALNSEPGVHTAIYAGPARNADDNMDKLLRELSDKTDRTARFRTIIVLYDGKDARYFEGIVNGSIADQKSGTSGFGYDPIFIPAGYDKTFADLPKSVKNKISHRAAAINNLCEYIRSC
jgi:XTP/dITP diphosphohydrolase